MGRMRRLRSAAALLGALALAFVSGGSAGQPGDASKPRLLILTDIGGDPDDTQSLIRLLLYACDFEIEGLVASAAGTPDELRFDAVKPELIREVVEAYGKVQPNLSRHRTGYPTASGLLAKVKGGNPKRGEASLGPLGDTEGSRWIIRAVDRPDPRPLNVAIWGGPTDLAQALWRVRHDRLPQDVRRFVSRLRVYAIGHQDDTGPWINANFPDLFYLLGNPSERDVLGKSRSGLDRRVALYRGMYLGGDESLTSREWLDTHVRRSHGPLGALYPDRTWTEPNPHGAMKEGDTPSWFYFLPNGLGVHRQPAWGSWGGRFRWERRGLYRDAIDTVGTVTDARATVWRWRRAYQAEFQARMDWCVREPREANHAPVARVNGSEGPAPLVLPCRAGESVRLTASGSSDPDGHALAYRWWIYPEAGGGAAGVELQGAEGSEARALVGAPAAGRDIHVILEVTDAGDPALTAYLRILLRVAGSPEFMQTDLFTAGEGGYALYRIPGLVGLADGSLLAYCEARRTGKSDWDEIDLMLRRSPDGGRTWEPARRLVSAPRIPKNPVAVAQGLGKDAGVTMNNPVAIVDRQPGVVHFLYCAEYQRCWYLRSTDGGRSFSPPREITATFEAFRPEYPWKVLATGPGHGLQLSGGRLVVPVWLSTGTGGHAHRPSCVSTIVSDDGGTTWQRGEIVVNDPTLANPSETVAVELEDGRVMLNIRHEGRPGEQERRRAVSVSPDGSAGWSPVRSDPALAEPICMAALLRLTGLPRGESRLLFANPDNPVDRQRRNLTLRLSRDEGATWAHSRVVDPGPSGYCDLAAGPRGEIYCLYERGQVPAGGARPAALTLVRLDLEWLTGGRDRLP